MSCSKKQPSNPVEDNNEDKVYEFYIGTYTDGKSEGIYKTQINEQGIFSKPILVAKSENPSFIAFNSDKSILVAVNENEDGTVESFRVEQESLIPINKQTTKGAHPCFVEINQKGQVISTNYSSGSLALHQLNANGELSPILDTIQHIGKGTTPRQEGPHAHSAWFVPTNEKQIISCDLGTNQLWFSSLADNDENLIKLSPETIDMEIGAGPRHLVFHPNNKWLYVINELNNTISKVILNDQNNYELSQSVSTLPNDFTGESFCADIKMTADGRHIYASNRGHNSIAVFSINMETGNLTLIQNQVLKGDWPRNISLAPMENFLIVANQKSNTIESYQINEKNGTLTFSSSIDSPSPVCILFNE